MFCVIIASKREHFHIANIRIPDGKEWEFLLFLHVINVVESAKTLGICRDCFLNLLPLHGHKTPKHITDTDT